MIEYKEDANFAWTPRVLSIGIHAGLVGLALIPWAAKIAPPKLHDTAVVLYEPFIAPDKPLVLPGKSGGGGGGGKHELTPPSLGQLPRAADRQLVPPDPEPPKNPQPELIVEPTIVAPEIAEMRSINLLNIGDPNGIVGPPSAGPGDNGGIGTGRNGGVGSGDGTGAGDGKDGGIGGGNRRSGGSMIAPKLIYRIDPEYSEEARRAHFEGIVVLEAIVRRDGGVDLVHVLRSVGLGLDQSAVDAVKKWRFRPATQNGAPVDATMKIEVTFTIR